VKPKKVLEILKRTAESIIDKNYFKGLNYTDSMELAQLLTKKELLMWHLANDIDCYESMNLNKLNKYADSMYFDFKDITFEELADIRLSKDPDYMRLAFIARDITYWSSMSEKQLRTQI
jgi:hypothetical protein